MKARLSAVVLIAIAAVGFTVVPSYAVPTLTVTPDPIPAITPSNPNTAFQVTAEGHTGSYTLHWGAQPADGGGGPSGDATGVLGAGGVTQPVTLNGADLYEGSYTLYGTLTVSDPDTGTFEGDFIPAHFEVRRTKPTVATATASHSTIYPLVNTTKYPGSTQISMWDVDTTLNYDIVIRNGTGALVRRLDATLADDYVTFVATWNGRYSNGVVVPAGTYKAYLVDNWGNTSDLYATITVSTKKLVLKTYKATVSAAASTDQKLAGMCSVLRKPSKRGWAGSLGYYSNTKCNSNGDASIVTTVNSLRLPAAASYKDLRVSLYGGAARAKPRSRGVLSYMTTNGDFVSSSTVTPALGTHNGPTRGAAGKVFSDRYFVWSFGTAYGNRYDVKNFTVTARYYVLG